jgi:hypothetical protein
MKQFVAATILLSAINPAFSQDWHPVGSCCEPPYPSNYIVQELRVIEIQPGKKVLYIWRQQFSEAAKRQAIAEGNWTYPDNPGWTPEFIVGPYLADCVNRIFFQVYTSGSKVTMQPRGKFGGGSFPGKACSLADFEGLED